MNAAQKLATYADVLAAPDTVTAELIHGTLYQTPRPAPKHSHATLAIGSLLSPPFGRGRGGPGDWVFLIEPELHLGPHVLVPDLAGWRRERLPALPADAHIDLAPDWICEVLSPSTARHDRSVKMPIHAAEQVAHAWLIDVQAQTLEPGRVGSERGWRRAGAGATRAQGHCGGGVCRHSAALVGWAVAGRS